MRNKKKIAALATGALVLGSAGVAYAYWTTSGSSTGTGSTTAGDALLTITQNPAGEADTSVDLDPMYPGDDAQDLVVRVRNSSTTDSYLVSTVSAWVTTDAEGCGGSDFLLNGQPAPGLEVDAVELGWTDTELDAGQAAETAGDTIQFNNKSGENGNQDACKGAVVTVHYLAS